MATSPRFPDSALDALRAATTLELVPDRLPSGRIAMHRSSMRSHPPRAELRVDDTWTNATGDYAGQPLLVRLRSRLRPLAGHPELPYRLSIRWRYRPTGAHGMPSEEQQRAMGEFEDALVRLLEADRVGVLTVVYTAAGERTWVFYCTDRATAAALVDRVPPAAFQYPIQLTGEPDPEWRHYLRLLDDLGPEV